LCPTPLVKDDDPNKQAVMPASLLLPASAWRSRPADSPTSASANRLTGLLACPIHQRLERWVYRRLGDIAHERRVVTIAQDLFATTRPLHDLAPRDLRLLGWAAVVHDVGRSICDATHPKDGAALLLKDVALPLAPAERRHLAYLTLHHRDKVPPLGEDEVLDKSDDHVRLLKVLALLRAADGLDNRALGQKLHRPPRVEFGLVRKVKSSRLPTLHVSCYLERESLKARRVYRRRKKFRLLEKVLECEVTSRLIAGDGKR
jgi:exopolyphosphatase/pppGpp-phosphohydrolase